MIPATVVTANLSPGNQYFGTPMYECYKLHLLITDQIIDDVASKVSKSNFHNMLQCDKISKRFFSVQFRRRSLCFQRHKSVTLINKMASIETCLL